MNWHRGLFRPSAKALRIGRASVYRVLEIVIDRLCELQWPSRQQSRSTNRRYKLVARFNQIERI
jgi:hypothetical protein